jgi:hypothetical protein
MHITKPPYPFEHACNHVVYKHRNLAIHFFTPAFFFTGVLAPMKDHRHAHSVCRAWSALAVTVACAVAVTRSPFGAVGFAAHTAVELALSFIYTTDRGPARARGFLIALGRTFGDATMNAASWCPFYWFPHPTHNQSNTNGSSNGSLKSRGTESHYVIFVWMHN